MQISAGINVVEVAQRNQADKDNKN